MKIMVASSAVFLTGLFASYPSQAQPSATSDELRDVASCRQIPKARDRLRCFDKTTEFLKGVASSEAANDTIDGAESSSLASAVENNAPASAEAETIAAAKSPDTPDDYDAENGVDPVASFGAEDLLREDEGDRLKELRAVATVIRQDQRGKFIIELDNGQVWRQLPGDTKTLRVRRDREGDGHDVVIRKRSLGAYALRLTTAKRSILVRRVK
jgi:hypothetical protein